VAVVGTITGLKSISMQAVRFYVAAGSSVKVEGGSQIEGAGVGSLSGTDSGGASAGGSGGSKNGNNVGVPYGSFMNPISPGSRGGYSFDGRSKSFILVFFYFVVINHRRR